MCDATTEPSIRFLIPYFGSWPFWFPFFLESCRHNPSIDWLFFTDCGIPQRAPDNVSFIETSFADYCRLVSERLSIDFRPNTAYKLCDIKPALGAIHVEHLEGYDFWAFGDIDLIYGDLRNYFTAQRLSRYDLFSTHERRISGHLCLLRNNKVMREAFSCVPSWQKKFEDPSHLAFDESAFCHLFIRHKNWPEVVRRFVNRFNFWRRHSEFLEAYSTPHGRIPWHDGSRQYPETWFWEHGRLTNSSDLTRTYPYFHFMVWKKCWRAEEELSRQLIPELMRSWEISSSGFTIKSV